MDTSTVSENSTSVLAVNAEPSILIFIARLLEASGMRALLARNGAEALEIVERAYVPVDLVLTDAAILERHGAEFLDRLRQNRPGIRDLCIATSVDDGIIRIQLMAGSADVEPAVCDGGLIESVRRAVSVAMVNRAGHLN